MARIKYILILVYSAGCLCAQAQHLQFKNIWAKDGITHSNNSVPVVDHNGHLWIPTDNGIYSYDGAKLNHYNQERFPGMSSDPIRQLFIDSKNRLWASFYRGNIAYMDQDEVFVPIENSDKYYLNGLVEIHQNGVLLIGKNEVYFFDEYSHRFVEHQKLTKLVENESIVSFFYIDHRHFLFTKSNQEVVLISFDQRGDFQSHQINIRGCVDAGIYDDYRIFMMSGQRDALFLYNWADRELVELKSFKPLSGQNELNLVSVTTFNKLFYGLSSDNNLLIFDSTGYLKTMQYPDFLEENGLPVSMGLKIYCTKNGMMLIKHQKGLSLTYLGRHYLNRKTTFAGNNKIFDNHIASITPDSKGNLYLTTFSGLIHWSRENNDISSIGNTALTRRFLVGNSMVHKDKIFSTGFLYPVSVYHYDGTLYQSLSFDGLPVIRNIYFWKDHYALLGTENGIFILDLNNYSLAPRSLLPGIEKIEGRIVDIKISKEHLLVATSFADGLHRYKISNGELNSWSESDGMLSNRIYSVAIDHQNNIYAGTRLGLNIIDSKGNIKSIDKRSGLKYDRVDNVIADRKGKIWLTNLSSIFKYDPQTQSLSALDKFFMGSPNSFTIGSKASLGDTIIFFGGTDGLAYFHYSQTIEEELSFGSSMKITSGLFDGLILMESKSVKLPYDKAYLPIEMIVNDLMINDRCFFRHRMLGQSNDWSSGSRNREISFNLSPGSYQFEFEFSLDGRSWKKSPVLLSILVTPPFWLNKWFLTIGFFAIGLLGYGVNRYRINKLLAIEQIRTKIASDLHDDVASTVGSISYYSEYGKSIQNPDDIATINILDKIGVTAREAMESMRDVIWATQVKYDNYQSLKQKLYSYGEDLAQSKNMEFMWKDELISQKMTLAPLARRNIYLIIKEAITNVIKYSEASTVLVEIAPMKKGYSFLVSDNGKGFDIQRVVRGNGLDNMNLRASQLKATLSIQTIAGGGTIVKLVVPDIN